MAKCNNGNLRCKCGSTETGLFSSIQTTKESCFRCCCSSRKNNR